MQKKVFVFGIFLLLILAVPAVSGMTGELGTGGTEQLVINEFNKGPECGTGDTDDRINATIMNLNIQKPVIMTLRAAYASWIIQNKSNVIIPDSDYFPVQAYVGAEPGVLIGEGTLSYVFYYAQQGVFVDIAFTPDLDNWTVPSGYSGAQLVWFKCPTKSNWAKFGMNNLSNNYGNQYGSGCADEYILNATAPRVGLFGTAYAGGTTGSFRDEVSEHGVAGEGYWGSYKYSFRNQYSITKSNSTGFVNIELIKNIYDEESGTTIPYSSQAYITNGANVIYYNETTRNNNDLNYVYYWGLPIRLDVQDYRGVWWNTSTLYDVAALYNYEIQVDNETVSIGQTISPRIFSADDVTLSGLSRIHWQEGPATGGVNEIPVGGNSSLWQFYVKKGGTWYGWDETTDDFTNNVGATAPNPISFSFTSAGVKTLYADIYTTGGTNFFLTKNVTVQGTDFCTVVIYVKDKSGAFVSGSEVDIQDLTTGTWTNQSTNTGIVSYKTPPGALFKVIASKSGYEYDEGTFSSGAGGECTYTIVTMSLFKLSSVSTQCALYFKVRDYTTSAELSGARIKLDYTDPWTGSIVSTQLNTNSAGVAEFNVSNSTDISWTATKTNYASQSGSLNSGTLGYYQVVVQMVPQGQITTLTTAPTTATPTTVRTTGNVSGFWGQPSRTLEFLGANADEIPVLLAFLIILLGALIGGAGASLVINGNVVAFSPVGAELGMVAGFFFCFAAGFLPPYIIVLIICFMIGYFALRYWR